VAGRERARIARGAASLAVAVIFATPIVLVVLGSLRPVGLPPARFVELFTGPFSLDAYRRLPEVLPLGVPAVHSVLVVIVAVPLAVVCAAWAGFAIARLPARHGVFLAACAVVVLLVPVTSLFVGRVTVFHALGLTDTLVPLMATGLIGVSPVSVLVFAWAYRRVPPALFDIGAEMGLGPMTTWWRIAVPLTRGVSAVVAAVAFVLTWNDYLGPLIYLSDRRRATLPLAIGTLSTLDGPRQPIMLAGAVLAGLPVVVVVLALLGRVGSTGEREA
jgi:multiple sugar transport system permease protein